MTIGQLLRAAVQAVYFIVLARSLSLNDYGLSAGMLALAALIAPYVGFGAGTLLLRDLARNTASPDRSWSTALVATVSSGLLISVALAAVSGLVLPSGISFANVVVVLVADLVVVPIITVATAGYQALGNLFPLATGIAFVSLIRLGLIVVLSLRPGVLTLTEWAWAYLGGSAIPALVIAASLSRRVGIASPSVKLFRRNFWTGLTFAVSTSSQNFYNDADKLILGRLDGGAAAGIYTAAYRVVDMAFTPLRSILAVALPKFFAAATSEEVHDVRSRFMRRGLVLAATMSAGSAACAPVLPIVLGPQFRDSVVILLALSPIPILRYAHVLFADQLAALGHQMVRTIAQVVIAIANVFLNIWLIPKWGIMAATVISLGSDLLLLIAMWYLTRLLDARRLVGSSSTFTPGEDGVGPQ